MASRFISRAMARPKPISRKRFSGKKDTPLTATGREQAAQIGLVLKRDVGSRRRARLCFQSAASPRPHHHGDHARNGWACRRAAMPPSRASRKSIWAIGTS